MTKIVLHDRKLVAEAVKHVLHFFEKIKVMDRYRTKGGKCPEL